MKTTKDAFEPFEMVSSKRDRGDGEKRSNTGEVEKSKRRKPCKIGYHRWIVLSTQAHGNSGGGKQERLVLDCF
jgi:hypothetical protein